MKIIIIGGSNSLRSNGYSAQLADSFPEAEIVNLSIGASPSHMGFYRLSAFDDLSPGDLVIWEYALNDAMYCSVDPDVTDLVLRYVEATIRLVREAGARLVPFVFTTRRIENAFRRRDYRSQLHFLFSHYGIAFTDFSHELRRRLQVESLDDHFFRDNAHYAMRPEFVDLVLERVSAALANPALGQPVAARQLYSRPNTRQRCRDRASSGLAAPFTNKILSLNAWSTEDEPVVFDEFLSSGTLDAVIVLTSPHPCAAMLETSQVQLNLSFRCSDVSKPGRRELRTIVPQRITKERVKIGPRIPLHFNTSHQHAAALVENGFTATTDHPHQSAAPTIVAILTTEKE